MLQHQEEGGLFLDVVGTQGTMISEHMLAKKQILPVRGDPFLAPELSLDILDSVRRYHFKSDGLAYEGLYEDLHATTQAEHQPGEGWTLSGCYSRSGYDSLRAACQQRSGVHVRVAPPVIYITQKQSHETTVVSRGLKRQWPIYAAPAQKETISYTSSYMYMLE